MRLYFFLALFGSLLVTNYKLYSQEQDNARDFIVTNNNDTIYGKVKNNLLRKSDKVVFMQEKQAKYSEYNPIEIKAFYSASEGYFISEVTELDVSPNDLQSLRDNPNPEIKMDTVFLKVIQLGTANLYSLNDDAMKLHFFLSKPGAGIIELVNYSYLDYGENYWDAKGNKVVNTEKARNQNNIEWTPKDYIRTVPKYKGILNYYFSDCPKATKKIETLEFSEQALRDIVCEYNNCHTRDNQQYASKSKNYRAEIYGNLGVSHVRADYVFKGEEIIDFESRNTFVAGIDFNYNMKGKYRFVSIVNGLHYSQFKFDGQTEYQRGTTFYNQKAHISPAVISLTSMLRFCLPNSEISPYLNFGIRNCYVLLSKNLSEVTTTSGGASATHTYELIEHYKKYQLGAVIGMGLNYRRFGIEARYYPFFGTDLDKAVARNFAFSSIDLKLNFKIFDSANR
jgi:hypothetical protein